MYTYVNVHTYIHIAYSYVELSSPIVDRPTYRYLGYVNTYTYMCIYACCGVESILPFDLIVAMEMTAWWLQGGCEMTAGTAAE